VNANFNEEEMDYVHLLLCRRALDVEQGTNEEGLNRGLRTQLERVAAEDNREEES
jgi:hypothetical protein